ncbi:hypothetical protein L3X38_026562 [Prunus dulcis]|uniref:Integrase catalytic domain-containing protein n=1 Tax=Prunus dulcis TaxID=3755 RepID=A0AAD4VNJ7_PRUDU|nr:hypothetical protein L3X38_026562 [Prunus dulcis]
MRWHQQAAGANMNQARGVGGYEWVWVVFWVHRWEIKTLRFENGGEYRSDHFLKVCRDEGIVKHFTVKETLQHNGVAERMNRTSLEKVRCMLSNAGLGKVFWAQAITYASHLTNRLPTAANKDKCLWSSKPCTDYEYLHIFGCPAYFHVRENNDVTKTMSGSKHVELLKTPVVPVKSDDLDTSLIVDFDDENKNNEEDAFTQDPS